MSEMQSILPTIRSKKDFEYAITRTKFSDLILLEISISDIHWYVKEGKKAGKRFYLHADLIKGIKSDEHAIKYLVDEFSPIGIISTRHNVVQYAMKLKVKGILRIFLLDNKAVETALHVIKNTNPDYIEILPGVLPEWINYFSKETNIPLLTGGLIRTTDEVEIALKSGAKAVTTSDHKLWKIYSAKI